MLTTLFVLLLFSSITSPSYSARTLLNLVNPPLPQPRQIYQPTMTFVMQDILTTPTQQTTTMNNNPQNLPFSKPISNLPSIQGVGIPFSSQTSPNYDSPSTQTLGIAFPATASSLRGELEFGQMIDIEEDMYEEDKQAEFRVVGKTKGVFVEIGSDGENTKKNPSYMMALTTSFLGDKEGNYIDSLKLFGVQRRDVLESHVAVIGGTGKFEDSNGYAIVKVLTLESSDQEEPAANKFLLFNVYLS